MGLNLYIWKEKMNPKLTFIFTLLLICFASVKAIYIGIPMYSSDQKPVYSYYPPSIDHRKETEPTCPEGCSYVLEPVCGTNGQTYGNKCEFQQAACQSSKNIAIAYEGECKTRKPKYSYQ